MIDGRTKEDIATHTLRPVVYIAGKYRDTHERLVAKNVYVANSVAFQLWEMGYAGICPHTNTDRFQSPELSSTHILEGYLEIVKRCDCVVMLPNWNQSEGAKAEFELAIHLGLPVYHWPDHVDVLRSKIEEFKKTKDLKVLA